MEDQSAQTMHTGLRLRERYRLEEPLAKGAVCVVYRGEDETLRRRVAIKAVPPAHAASYRAALVATAALAHPAAVVVFDAVEQDEWLFLIQEYIAGVPLIAQVATGLAVERALNVGMQLCHALAYAHQHGLPHGDVTPAAVLLERDGEVRLNNFALPPDSAYFARWHHAEGTLVRTLDIAREPPAESVELGTPAADVRAVGLLLWQALAQPVQTGLGTDFRADVPFEVRHLLARAIVRGHAEAITTAENLAVALQTLADEVAATQEEELQPTPSLLVSARTTLAQRAPWSLDDTASTMAPWGIGGSTSPDAITAPGSAGAPRSADTPLPVPARAPVSSGPLRAPVESSPMRPVSLSGPLAVVAGQAPPSQPRAYTPPGQPTPYRAGSVTGRLAPPIPWSDDPQVARWAASPSRPSWSAAVRLYIGSVITGVDGRRGIGVLPVLLVGLVLFIVFFLIGYVAPLILPIH